MTTIVGVQYEDRCEIHADNQVTDSSGRIFTHPLMAKISEVGDFLVAGSGEVAPCDIAQHLWIPPKLTPTARKDIYHFMITKAMPSLRDCLKSNGYNFDEGKEDSPRFHLLIGVGGYLFDVQDDLSVVMSDDGIYGVGSGAGYAIGALHAGATPTESLEIAARISAYTCEPFMSKVQYKNG